MNIYFVVSAIYGGVYPEIHKFTFTELATNTGKYQNSEMFYALSELHTELIEGLQIGDKPKLVNINRDNPLSVGLIGRVPPTVYDSLEETIE